MFQYWEVPRTEIGNVFQLFEMKKIIFQSEKARSVFTNYQVLLTPPEDLPPLVLDKEWIRKPRYDCQESYIKLNPSKTKLILAFDPGLGKTSTSLTRTWALDAKKILIVVPPGLRKNWRTEIDLTMKSDDLVIYHGSIKQREKLILEVPNRKYVITTYSMLRELLEFEFDQIIFDEGHLMARPNTKTFKNAKAMVNAQGDAGVQILTGTPVLHKPSDLWALIHLLYPELAGEFHDFKNRYELVLKSFTKVITLKDADGDVRRNAQGEPITKKIEIPWITEPQRLDELHERTKAYTYRVSRDGYVDFADSLDFVYTELVGRQKQLYQSIGRDVLLQLSDRSLPVPTQIAQLTRMIQVSEGAFNLDKAWKDSGKLEVIKDDLKNTTDKRIVWHLFKQMGYELLEAFKDEIVVFNGDMSENHKQMAKWSFQGVRTDADEAEFKRLAKVMKWKFKPGEARIFSSTISRTASLGYDLQLCDYQLGSSWHWNGTINKQAWDRIKRPDQKSLTVYTKPVLTSGTIDERSLKIVLENLKTSTHILDGKNSGVYRQISTIVNLLREQIK